MTRRRLLALFAALALAALWPATVAAHPLGNFTINHYAGLRIGADRILLDVVSDQAEIPTFQERQRIDTNGDGTVSDPEIAAERLAACPRLAGQLVLTVAGAPVPLTTTAAGVSFPAGSGGLPTMRTVCEYEAVLTAPLTAATAIGFEDRSNPDRIGWREIVAVGNGMTLASDLPATSVSNRLSLYPQGLLSQALDVRVGTVSAVPGGPAVPAFVAPDATPLTAGASTSAGGSGSAAAQPVPAAGGAVPGGVGGEISGLLGATDLTPLALLLSFITAIALGAGHAVTPGHGKTIMAAYLVGSRGSMRHALGLGLATAVSHTIGVLLLALLILAAGSALPADRVYPVLTAVSGILVVAIGAWLLASQLRRRLRHSGHATQSPAPTTGAATGVGAAGDHAHDDGGGHSHDPSDSPGDHSHDRDGHGHVRLIPAPARRYGQQHAAYAMAFEGAAATTSGSGGSAAMGVESAPVAAPDGVHRHGWRVHSHVPTTVSGEPTTLTWKSLFALGLAGGLVPSTNALLILIATVATGRAAYGLVLVIAFGIGMAAVLVGVGLAMVYGSGMIGRVPRHSAFSRLVGFAPIVAALTVLMLGLYLTQQALTGARVL